MLDHITNQLEPLLFRMDPYIWPGSNTHLHVLLDTVLCTLALLLAFHSIARIWRVFGPNVSATWATWYAPLAGFAAAGLIVSFVNIHTRYNCDCQYLGNANPVSGGLIQPAALAFDLREWVVWGFTCIVLAMFVIGVLAFLIGLVRLKSRGQEVPKAVAFHLAGSVVFAILAANIGWLAILADTNTPAFHGLYRLQSGIPNLAAFF